MAKKKTTPKKKASRKKVSTPKTVKSLDTQTEAEICALYKRVVKKPLHDHKHEELIRQIREVYKAKGIIEEQSQALIISPSMKKAGFKKGQTVNYTFNYDFNNEEITQKAEQLASACIERNKITDEKKHVNSEYQAKIDAKTSEINILSGHIESGFEKRTAACQMFKDFDKGFKYYFCNGKQVGEEKLNQHDYQMQADFEEGKGK